MNNSHLPRRSLPGFESTVIHPFETSVPHIVSKIQQGSALTQGDGQALQAYAMQGTLQQLAVSLYLYKFSVPYCVGFYQQANTVLGIVQTVYLNNTEDSQVKADWACDGISDFLLEKPRRSEAYGHFRDNMAQFEKNLAWKMRQHKGILPPGPDEP